MEDKERTEIERDVYVSLRDYFHALRAQDQKRIDERFDALDKALVLQAEEYARRLHDLNGSFKRDLARQSDYVTTDKWETTNTSEKTAREAALLRVNEKFETGIQHVNQQFADYVKRYELERREIDLRLAAQAGAAEEAKRQVEAQGRKIEEQQREQGRKQGRNLALASLALGVIVFLANFIPSVVS